MTRDDSINLRSHGSGILRPAKLARRLLDNHGFQAGSNRRHAVAYFQSQCVNIPSSGVPYPYCYHPIIRRNTPLPITRADSYYTSYPEQTEVDIQIFQGDDEDALKNILVGDFRVERLTPCQEPNEVMCRMSLDLDGILHVTAIEKRSGKSKHVTIANALQAKSETEIAAARKRIQDLFASRETSFEEAEEDLDEAVEEEAEGEVLEEEVGRTNGKVITMPPAWTETRHEAVDLIQRSRRLLDQMHAEDKEEAIALHEAIESAIASHDQKSLAEAVRSLKELLFFVEGN